MFYSISEKNRTFELLFHQIDNDDGSSTGIPDHNDPDWDDVRFQTQLHGVGPLFHSCLNEALHDLLPDHIQKYAKEQHHLNGLRIKKMQNILREFLSLTHEENLKIMPLKGSLLVNGFYKDQALKPMADLDFLVLEKDLDRLTVILETCGLSYLEKTKLHLVFKNESGVVSIEGEHPENPIKVELHTRMMFEMSHMEFDITDLAWEHSTPGFLGFGSVFKLEDWFLWIHLACHASQHMHDGVLRAIQIYDLQMLSAFLDASGWEKIIHFSQANDLTPLIYAPAALVNKQLKKTIPQDWLTRISDQMNKRFKRFADHTSIRSYAMACEERTMRLYRKALKLTGEKLLFVLNRITLKYALYYFLNLNWLVRGMDRRKALLRFLFPALEDIEIWYPNWGKKYSTYAVYLFHLIFILFSPLALILHPEHLRQYVVSALQNKLLPNLNYN